MQAKVLRPEQPFGRCRLLRLLCKRGPLPGIKWRDENAKQTQEKLDLSERCPKCLKAWPWGRSKMDTHFALRCPNCDAYFEDDRFVCYGVPRD